MRSYGQYCAVAKALDVIGDRWNLLVIRELLLRGASRYTDLQGGLPGIATNLLAERLRALEQAGVVTREEAPPPVATTLFSLTERGAQLAPVVRELARWGAPLMAERGDGEAFRAQWLAMVVRLSLVDRLPDRPPVTVELRADGEAMTVETAGGGVRTRPGPAEHPDLVLSGSAERVVGVLAGRLDVRDLDHEGDPEVLRRLRPERAAA
jgi:DNA-binding HxlR family transcriptional regulator